MLRRCIVVANLIVVSTVVLLGFGTIPAGAQTEDSPTVYISVPVTESTTPPTETPTGLVFTGEFHCTPIVFTTCEGVPSGGSVTLSVYPGSAPNTLTGYLDLAFNNGATAATTVTGTSVGNLRSLSGVIPQHEAFAGDPVYLGLGPEPDEPPIDFFMVLSFGIL